MYRLSFFLFLLMFLAHSGANAQSESKDLVWEGEFRYSMVFDRQMKMELLGVEDRPYDSDGFQFWDAKLDNIILMAALEHTPVKSGIQDLIKCLHRQIQDTSLTIFPRGLKEFPADTIISNNQKHGLVNLVYRYYTELESGELKEHEKPIYVGPEDTPGLDFVQQWSYDQKNHRLKVVPTYLGLKKRLESEFGQLRGFPVLAFLPTKPGLGSGGKQLDNSFQDSEVSWAGQFGIHALIDENGKVTMQVEELRKAYFKEYPHQSYSPFYNTWEIQEFQSLKTVFDKSLPQILAEEALAGELSIYSDRDLQHTISAEELKKLLMVTDTIIQENPQNGEEQTLYKDRDIQAQDFLALEIQQRYKYKASSQELTSEIKSVGLMIKTYNPRDGLFYKFRPLIWIKFAK